MSVHRNSEVTFLDGPPSLNCVAFAVHEGRLIEAVDCFTAPFRKTIIDDTSGKLKRCAAGDFFGAAMLAMTELEYTGITKRLDDLNDQFTIRESRVTDEKAA